MTYIVLVTLRDESQKLFVLEDYKISEKCDEGDPSNEEHNKLCAAYEAMLESLDGAANLTDEQLTFVKTEFLSGTFWKEKERKGWNFLSGDFRLIQVKYYA